MVSNELVQGLFFCIFNNNPGHLALASNKIGAVLSVGLLKDRVLNELISLLKLKILKVQGSSSELKKPVVFFHVTNLRKKGLSVQSASEDVDGKSCYVFVFLVKELSIVCH